jgi:hypothetical protein
MVALVPSPPGHVRCAILIFCPQSSGPMNDITTDPDRLLCCLQPRKSPLYSSAMLGRHRMVAYYVPQICALGRNAGSGAGTRGRMVLAIR